MARDLRLTNTARLVSITSDEIYAKSGIIHRQRSTRSVADKRRFGSAGNGMKSNSRDCSRGADQPKKPSGTGGY